MFCSNCGQELPNQAKFCPGCGSRVISDISSAGENVVIDGERNCAEVFGRHLTEAAPTSLYVEIIRNILMRYPELVGQKETHFTMDKTRADSYTGKTREVEIAGKIVYIKTGLSTKDKWKGVDAVCKLAGISFSMSYIHETAEKKAIMKSGEVDGNDGKISAKVSFAKEPRKEMDSALNLNTEQKSVIINNIIELFQLLIDHAVNLLPIEIYEKQCKKYCLPIKNLLIKGEKEKFEVDLGVSEAEKENLAHVIAVICHTGEIYPTVVKDPEGQPVILDRLEHGGYRISVRDMQGLELMLRLLAEFVRLGYGNASYVMGLVYGRHMVTYATDWDVQVYKPDQKKMLACFKNAVNAKYPCSAAMLALGCFYMSMRHCIENADEIARQYLSCAARCGEEDAEVYLKNLERLTQNRQLQIQPTYLVESGSGTPETRIFATTNCIEYQDYLYFLGPKTMEEDGHTIATINRMELKSGKIEELVKCKNEPIVSSIAGDKPQIAIFKDYIYFVSKSDMYSDMCRMRLDGSNIQKSKEFKNSYIKGIHGIFPSKIIYIGEHGLYEYIYSTQKHNKVWSNPYAHVTAISENEIVIQNEKVKNLATGETLPLNRVYPGTKKKQVLLVDAVNEIAYCMESSKDGYSESRIIGTDKKGEVVDIWRVPVNRMVNFLREGCSRERISTMCFNGSQFSVSAQLRRDEVEDILREAAGGANKEFLEKTNNFCMMPFVSRFDRCGNEILVYDAVWDNDQNNYFGVNHYITESTICVPKICEKPDGTNYKWITCLSEKCQKALPFSYFYHV